MARNVVEDTCGVKAEPAMTQVRRLKKPASPSE
jgi:hypothetical protein